MCHSRVGAELEKAKEENPEKPEAKEVPSFSLSSTPGLAKEEKLMKLKGEMTCIKSFNWKFSFYINKLYKSQLICNGSWLIKLTKALGALQSGVLNSFD